MPDGGLKIGKPNAVTALLEALLPEGCIVTLDAMGCGAARHASAR